MDIEEIMDTEGGPMATATTTSPTWKLYDNPFFIHHPFHRDYRRGCCSNSPFWETTTAHHHRAVDSRIRELKAELELERRLRKKAEAINKTLRKDVAEERRRREEAERDVEDLSEELGRARSEVDRARADVEEERKMMRVAEVLREERVVQMKLIEAKVLVKKLSEPSPIPERHCPKAGEDGQKKSGDNNILGSGDGNGPGVGSGWRKKKQQQRKEVENPHIRRGIMGFVEFPRVMRTRACGGIGSAAAAGPPREGRGDAAAGPKLECQKALLRVLLKNSRVIPVAGSLGSSGTESLVM